MTPAELKASTSVHRNSATCAVITEDMATIKHSWF